MRASHETAQFADEQGKQDAPQHQFRMRRAVGVARRHATRLRREPMTAYLQRSLLAATRFGLSASNVRKQRVNLTPQRVNSTAQ